MKKLNRSRFLDKLAPSHTCVFDHSSVEEADNDMVDLRSFCGNSDLFSKPSAPTTDRNLSKEELQRQARFYRS